MIEKINFGIGEHEATVNNYRSMDYAIILEHLNVDSSGYLDVQLHVPCTIDKETITADGIDTVTISNLPNPSTIDFDGQEYEVVDGEFQFTIDLAGDYVIRCNADDYSERTYLINAS